MEIVKYISEGGFAHVYTVRVEPALPGQPVACLKRVAVPDKVYLNLLRAEVEAMQRLKGYSNIVQYVDSHAERMKSGMGYEVLLLMEYCEGGGLIDFMNTRLRDQLKEHEILKIMNDITLGLAHMHYLNPPLIHRDLKIENVLLTGDGTYKLCDFGSVSPVLRVPNTPQEFKILDDDIQHHTTMQYRSPEMIDITQGYPINEKSDIWALGVFLYKLCYYTTPFERGGNAAILKAQYVIPQSPQYSDRLKNMIRVLLQPVPTQRPTAYQVLEEISAMRQVPNPLTRPNTPSTSSAHLPASHSSTSPVPGPIPMHNQGYSAPKQAKTVTKTPPTIPSQPQMIPGSARASQPIPQLSLTASYRSDGSDDIGAYRNTSPANKLQASISGNLPERAIQIPTRTKSPAAPNLETSPTTPIAGDGTAKGQPSSFESKFPVLSPTTPLLTGDSAFDFSLTEATSRYPPMNELEPQHIHSQVGNEADPFNTTTMKPLPELSIPSASTASLAIPAKPPRPDGDSKARAVRKHAQAQIQAAREQMLRPDYRSPSPEYATDRSELRGEYRSEPEGRLVSVDSDSDELQNPGDSSSSDEDLVANQQRKLSDGYSTKIQRILNDVKENTVVLENDNSHMSSSVDFLRSLQPGAGRTHHHHHHGHPSMGVRHLAKTGGAGLNYAHSRSKSITNKLFGSGGRRKSQVLDDALDGSDGSDDGSGMVLSRVSTAPSIGEHHDVADDVGKFHRSHSASKSGRGPSSSGIKSRVNAYLMGQEDKAPPRRTARGYGKYTDEDHTHSDGEITNTRLGRQTSPPPRPDRHQMKSPEPPIPSKNNKPRLKSSDSSMSIESQASGRRLNRPPKPAHLARQSVGYP